MSVKSKQLNHRKSMKGTRIRTVLNEKQLHTLRTYYANNPRPDSAVKEKLVELTGLNSRVIRVWFQNKRCKDKKIKAAGEQTVEEEVSKIISTVKYHQVWLHYKKFYHFKILINISPVSTVVS